MEIMNQYPIKSKETAFRVLQGEAVVVLPLKSIIYTFDPVGTRIWELSNGRNMVSNIIEKIQAEFEVEFDEAKRDIVEFITELVSKNMLTLKEVSNDYKNN